MKLERHQYRILTGQRYLLPMLQVDLIGRRRASVNALVDTGAVFSIFPLKAAEDAEIPLPTSWGHLTQYGGSAVKGKLVPVEVLIAGRRLRPDVVFVEKLDFPYALLGRVGVFAHFREVSFLEMQRPSFEFRW